MMKFVFALSALLLLCAACEKEPSGPQFQVRSEGPLVAFVEKKLGPSYLVRSYFEYDAMRRVVQMRKTFLSYSDVAGFSTLRFKYESGFVRITEESSSYKGEIQTIVRLGNNGLLESATRKYIRLHPGQEIEQHTDSKETFHAEYDEWDRPVFYRFRRDFTEEKKWVATNKTENEETSLTHSWNRDWDDTDGMMIYKQTEITYSFTSPYEEPIDRHDVRRFADRILFSDIRNPTRIDFASVEYEELYPSVTDISGTFFWSEPGLLGEICPYLPKSTIKGNDLNYPYTYEFDDGGRLRKVTITNTLGIVIEWEITYLD